MQPDEERGSQHGSHPERSERTTVTLPTSMARRLRVVAEARQRSASHIVREALEAYLESQVPVGLPGFVAIGDSGRGDLSERIEDLIASEAGE
jgi:hypothetical protein